VTRLCPSAVASRLVDPDNWRFQLADLQKHESRRADSNREPPDYKIQDWGVGKVWMMLALGVNLHVSGLSACNVVPARTAV
jgi:hypothetical protein